MAKSSAMWNFLHLLLLLSSPVLLLHPSAADVGTAAYYGPPYLPTDCYGNDESQFPPSNLFVAAGEGIWDNGAACGREYLVKCLSSVTPKACNVGQTIQVKVVDQAATLRSKPSKLGATMVLSRAAFAAIVNQSSGAVGINIEFRQL